MTTGISVQADRHLTDGPVVDAAHVDVTYRVRDTDRLTVRDVSFQIGRASCRERVYGLV